LAVRVIGVCGAAGVGKDTFARYFLHDNWKVDHFADPLKDLLIDHFGFTWHDLYTRCGKASFNERWGMTNREALQRFGTDALRNNFCYDVWVKVMELRIEKNLAERNSIIIPDTRFDNEADLIHRFGGLVFRVDRRIDSLLSKKEIVHASEAGVSDSLVDEVVANNGTLDDLRCLAQAYWNLV